MFFGNVFQFSFFDGRELNRDMKNIFVNVTNTVTDNTFIPEFYLVAYKSHLNGKNLQITSDRNLSEFVFKIPF